MDTDPPAMRRDGVVTQWNDDRGFGFVTSPGRQPVFVHISGFTAGGPRPALGDAVSYSIGSGRDGRPRAVGVRLVGAAPVASRARRTGASWTIAILFAVLFAVFAVLHPFPEWVIALYVGMSIVAFALYAQDKRAAQAGRWRVPESTLLAVGLIGGWPGAVVAQQTLRHKTRKPSFRVRFWATVLVNVGLFVGLVLIRQPWLAAVGLG
jgi:uncharacterized membrane protein YsdA (DUF1294 family)/cold shock CspA family protein